MVIIECAFLVKTTPLGMSISIIVNIVTILIISKLTDFTMAEVITVPMVGKICAGSNIYILKIPVHKAHKTE